jgi:hypothetical protein
MNLKKQFKTKLDAKYKGNTITSNIISSTADIQGQTVNFFNRKSTVVKK